MGVRAVIVEDHHEIREGLRMLVDGAPGFSCVGAFPSMEDALARFDTLSPDACLIDIGLPGMSGIEGVRQLRRAYPSLVLLILTVFEDNERIFDALCSGASGYLLKRTPPERLIEAIQDALNGGAPMSPEIARRVVDLFRTFRPPANSQHELTPHELRLLGMLAKGHSYKSAAHELGVTVNTVSYHLRNIYGKLQVHSKSEAVARALRDGLVR